MRIDVPADRDLVRIGTNIFVEVSLDRSTKLRHGAKTAKHPRLEPKALDVMNESLPRHIAKARS